MSTPGVREYSRVRSTPGDRGATQNRQGCASAAAHLTRRRRSTDEASRFFALTPATSAAPAAVRSIAASCTHRISVTPGSFLYALEYNKTAKDSRTVTTLLPDSVTPKDGGHPRSR